MGRRNGLAQRLMGALMVELGAKAIKAPLLRGQSGRRRLGGFRLERLVHPFMPTVLLRLARHDARQSDA